MNQGEGEVQRAQEGATGPSLGRRVLAVLLLVVCAFAVLSVVSDVRALGRSLASFDLTTLWAALGLVLGSYVLRFLRWQYFLRCLGVSVQPGLSALVFVSGFVMSISPGKMGEVLKSFLLHEYKGVSVARTAPIVVAERLLDLVALVLLVSLAGAGSAHGRLIAGLGALVVLGIVLMCTVRPFGNFVLDKLELVRPLTRITPKLREAYVALHALTRVRPFVIGACYATFAWGLECVATWRLALGFADIAMSLEGAGFAYAAGTLAGALAMLPGGLGVAELGMSGLFRVASPDLPLATAAALTILVRLCTLWLGVGLGGGALLTLRMSHKKL